MTDRPVVVLVGPPAAGKSRLARRVAKALNEPYVDTDALIVAAHGPIPEIFAKHGEQYFRAREREAVTTALAGRGVVSLGGGAIIDPLTRADLADHLVALITISPEAVEPRLDPAKRPLLVGGVESWKALVAKRQPWYEEVAKRTFDTSHRKLDTLGEEIVDWIRSEVSQ